MPDFQSQYTGQQIEDRLTKVIENEPFVAVYGETTFAEIKAAHDAGKIVLCRKGSSAYGFSYAVLAGISSSEAIFWLMTYSNGHVDCYRWHVDSQGWAEKIFQQEPLWYDVYYNSTTFNQAVEALIKGRQLKAILYGADVFSLVLVAVGSSELSGGYVGVFRFAHFDGSVYDELTLTPDGWSRRQISVTKSYLSLERMRKYLYRVTFDSIPGNDGGRMIEVACSSYVHNGKLYRNLDFKYDNAASFIVRTGDFEGMAFMTGLNDGELDDALIAQLPYHMVDGRNNNGIMMAVHVLFNDWGWRYCGNGNIPLTSLPMLVLKNVKSMATIADDLDGIIDNLKAIPDTEYILQVLVTDGETTYAIIPPTSNNQPYELVDASGTPKMSNFRWVDQWIVNRSDLQTRPTGVERWNMIDFTKAQFLPELRFTKAYGSPDRLSEFIGIDETTKDSTDEELTAIYDLARAEYLARERDGKTWQTMHSVVYGKRGMESLYIQEDWNNNCIEGVSKPSIDLAPEWQPNDVVWQGRYRTHEGIIYRCIKFNNGATWDAACYEEAEEGWEKEAASNTFIASVYGVLYGGYYANPTTLQDIIFAWQAGMNIELSDNGNAAGYPTAGYRYKLTYINNDAAQFTLIDSFLIDYPSSDAYSAGAATVNWGIDRNGWHKYESHLTDVESVVINTEDCWQRVKLAIHGEHSSLEGTVGRIIIAIKNPEYGDDRAAYNQAEIYHCTEVKADHATFQRTYFSNGSVVFDEYTLHDDDTWTHNQDNTEDAALATILNSMNVRIEALETALKNGVKSLTVDNLEIRNRLNQYVSEGNSYLRGAGAPSASVVPEGWNEEEYGPWTGVPQFIGQRYLNTVTNKWYTAKGNTAVSDWVQDTNA